MDDARTASATAKDRIASWLHDGQFDGRLIELGARFPREWMEIGRKLQGFPFDAEEVFERSKSLKTP